MVGAGGMLSSTLCAHYSVGSYLASAPDNPVRKKIAKVHVIMLKVCSLMGASRIAFQVDVDPRQ